MKVLFCGNHFRSSYLYTEKAVIALFRNHFVKHSIKFDESSVIVSHCHMNDVEKEIVNATVAIPFMTKFTPELMQKAPSLKMIMQYGVGLEGVDINEATKRGIWVSKINSEICGNAQACAEHSIFLAMALFRNIRGMEQSLAAGKIGYPTGRTFYHSKVMIYGYGNIGKQLLSRLLPFGIDEIVVISKYQQDQEDVRLHSNVRFIHTDQFHHHSYDSDIIFLCCSQNKENIGLVNTQFLSLFQKPTFLVNVARGGLLNYPDVLQALDSNRLEGVGIDVFHTEPFPTHDKFLQHPKVYATPHIAGVTEVSYQHMATLVAENVLRIWQGVKPHGTVNDIRTL